MRFHHLGIACEEIGACKNFVAASFDVVDSTPVIYDQNQNVDLCLLTIADGTHIELVSGKTVSQFVSKKQFLYHSCWEVAHLEAGIDKLYSNGAMLISAPKTAILFDNRRVAFLFSEIGIIELLEQKK